MNTTNFKTIDTNANETCVNGSFVFWLTWAENPDTMSVLDACVTSAKRQNKHPSDDDGDEENKKKIGGALRTVGSECSARWNHLLRRENDARELVDAAKSRKVDVQIRIATSQNKQHFQFSLQTAQRNKTHFWHWAVGVQCFVSRSACSIWYTKFFVFSFPATLWQCLMMTF